MIAVLLGTNPYSFERLVRAVDEIAKHQRREVFVQLGHTAYEPQTCRWERFLEHDRLLALLERAELVICQGGYGSIRDSLALGLKVIAVPRQPQLGESVDDQSGLVRALEQAGRILAVYDVAELEQALNKAADFSPSSSEPCRIPQIIRQYLDSW